MIIVKLLGGLGNQMFQYALGRKLSVQNKEPLYIDLSALLKRDEAIDFTFRDFELKIFNCDYHILKTDTFSRNYRRVFYYFSPIKNVLEQHISVDAVLASRGNVHLHGFWQNERYFRDISPILREDFSFKNSPNQVNKQMIEEIKNANSVSLHIRRGDYVTNPIASQVHGVCSNEYYTKAISLINGKFYQPHFFVFSDDMNWAKENLPSGNTYTFVELNNGSQSFEDMRLMSLCKNHIIANSSFSWWGAWLNKSEDKTVVAPTQWFKNTKTDIVPKEWIKI